MYKGESDIEVKQIATTKMEFPPDPEFSANRNQLICYEEHGTIVSGIFVLPTLPFDVDQIGKVIFEPDHWNPSVFKKLAFSNSDLPTQDYYCERDQKTIRKRTIDSISETTNSIWESQKTIPVLAIECTTTGLKGIPLSQYEHSDRLKLVYKHSRSVWLYDSMCFLGLKDIDPQEMLVQIQNHLLLAKADEIQAQLQRERKLSWAKNLLSAAENQQTGHKRQPISDDVQMFVWQRDGGKCVKCGSNENLEFDHIIPVSKGGANTARNLQLLCEGCNRSKSANIGG